MDRDGIMVTPTIMQYITSFNEPRKELFIIEVTIPEFKKRKSWWFMVEWSYIKTAFAAHYITQPKHKGFGYCSFVPAKGVVRRHRIKKIEDVLLRDFGIEHFSGLQTFREYTRSTELAKALEPTHLRYA